MDKVDIIVSRYNEDLNWTLERPFNAFQYIVYNKGDNQNFEKANVKQIINLPNVGRCDHTYLYHIVENYNQLNEILVFFPGSLNLQYKKKKAIRILNNIINSNFNNAYFIGRYHKNLKDYYKDFTLQKWKCKCPENFSKNRETKLKRCLIRPYGKWYEYFFNNSNPHWVTLGGVFSIDKRDVIQHPIIRYQRLLSTVNNHSNPEAGHYIERSWGAIFYPMYYTVKTK